MPRISVCLNRPAEPLEPNSWSAENENIDYCKRCWPTIEIEDLQRALGKNHGVSDELLEHDLKQCTDLDGCDHPPYDDCDYTCVKCGAKLTEEDD